MSVHSIPLADSHSLAGLLRRTRIVRLALAAALLAAGVAAFLLARTPELEPTPILPPGSNGVVVLDLSASTENTTLDRMHTVLTQLSRTKGRFGLVVFSSRAYEALAPNTPARELAPVARFFKVLPPERRFNRLGGAVAGPQYPTNPWAAAFSFGTSISKGLELARSILLQGTVDHPAVWLVSDLADSPQDRPLVSTVAREYVRSGIALNVIALDPTKADARFFRRQVGFRGSVVLAQPAEQVRLHVKHPFPVGYIVAAAFVALLLAANELVGGPLRWRARAVAA